MSNHPTNHAAALTAKRPRLKDGRIIPYTAASSDDSWGKDGGEVNIDSVDPLRWSECVERGLCWLCGERLSYWKVLIGNEHSAAQASRSSRTFFAPCAHEVCAYYGIISLPAHVRKLAHLGEDATDACLHFSRSYKVRRHVEKRRNVSTVVLYLQASPAIKTELLVLGEALDAGDDETQKDESA